MKSKAPLSLMEQLVMLLVFALAAALCLQVFLLSGQMSLRGEARDRAVTQVQNAAEVLKASGGDFPALEKQLGGTGDAEAWEIRYDENWKNISGEDPAYRLLITPVSTGDPMLGSASVSCVTSREDVLFQVTVSWQEVAHE